MGRPGPVSVEPQRPRISLRIARDDDASRLMEWRNDGDAVRFSGTGRPVTAAEHETWFSARRRDGGSRLWIAEEDGLPVGQVRLDVDRGVGTVSIAVAAEHRGRKAAVAMLDAMLAEVAGDPDVRFLRAVTHPQNLMSQHAFERAGYRRKEPTEQGWVVLERSSSGSGAAVRAGMIPRSGDDGASQRRSPQ